MLGLPANFGSFTPVTDRGVISTGPTPSSAAVPGIQVEGWFADDPTKQARFVLRFPDDWNGKLVVAGASGTRSEYNGNWGWSDYVLPKGYAYASQNKGVLNFHVVNFGSVDQPARPRNRAASISASRAARCRCYGCISTTSMRRNRSRMDAVHARDGAARARRGEG